MPKDTPLDKPFLKHFISIFSWVAILLVLIAVVIGDDILHELAMIYPDWSFPAFFIPWFLLVISSVQKLPQNDDRLDLQLWIMKTTIPLFILILPFFSKLIITTTALKNCTENCMLGADGLFGFEAYCVYFAIIILFLLNFLPSMNQKQSVENKS